MPISKDLTSAPPICAGKISFAQDRGGSKDTTLTPAKKLTPKKHGKENKTAEETARIQATQSGRRGDCAHGGYGGQNHMGSRLSCFTPHVQRLK